ncbi:Rid family hydrolase [Bradyrhizobium sp. sBnM-33]|uniref:Rid family hydrolase n=1 Tax=Bradyrhizobium sp. sBnM-33 TaxID=2831780 RepID=UPI001BD15A0D|nr:Rid family hydrolase [Bradyrhizobium sp. sBnM-33]WOH52594.1 Rid family hydrolase [Bradyrhizobium sp. sBnM-33]
MGEDWPILRSKGVAEGRSSGSAFSSLAFAVATSDDKRVGLEEQAKRCFRKIDGVLADLGTDRRYLLSATVFLSDLRQKARFDDVWNAWVGATPQHWPQRMCIGATLSEGTLVEISVVAAKVKR